jgi:hypothetical protein
MNQMARQSTREREDVFLKAAEESPLNALAMEKDFWVCFVLSHLFSLEDLPSVTFKGATSLTKGFEVLKRFSEDSVPRRHRGGCYGLKQRAAFEVEL